ncbi:hypothetical protein [Streptomyces sp. NPDC058401]|uniref:hypothetical protein n=1 Tax=Streptomyces sp. NPDC058401 TaxID=3346480 RepID=UPI00365D5D52
MTVHGCPSGSVCIYPEGAGWNNDRPSHRFSANKAHDLSGQEGYHYVLNNQTGGWRAWFCTGYGGGGTWYGPLYQDEAVNVNLSPINSIFVGP